MLQPEFTVSGEELLLSSAQPLRVLGEAYGRQARTTAGRAAARPHPLPGQIPMRWPDQTSVRPHNHLFHEVVMVCGGSATHQTGEYSETLQAGSVIVVPPGMTHGYTGLNDLVLANLFYLGEWLAEDLQFLWRMPELVHVFLASMLFHHPVHAEVPHFSIDAKTLGQCLDEVADMAAELARSRPRLLFVRACFLKVLVRLAAAYREQRPEINRTVSRGEVWAVLERAEACMQQGVPFDPGTLARQCGISQEHLGRIFRRATGLSPMAYFQRRRAQQAARLLLMPGENVTSVAHRLGYSDASHLRRAFGKQYGMPPSEYRDRCLRSTVHQ